MKTVTLICAVLFFIVPMAGQEISPADLQSANARLNFAVPDAPAFTILSYSPSMIIRPTSVKEVGLAVADFVRGGSVLPRAFAAEFSPGLLIGGRTLTIRQYNTNPFLYRTRISVASRTFDDNTGRIQASLGVRLTLTDEGDPRTDRAFIQGLSNLASGINQAIAKKVQVAPPTGTGPVQSEAADVDALEQEVSRLREKQQDEKWNANIAELAAAVRFSSTDSLARNTAADKYQVWLAGSFRVAQWGQFIFNLSASVERDVSFKMDSTRVAMNSRFYFGSNGVKVFGEGQITALEKSPALYLFNVGGEINPISSFWLEFAAGFEKRGAEPAIIRTAFHVRWSLPETLLPGS